LTWATSGYGTSSHLTEEMLNRDLKLGMQIIPYRGAAPQLTDVAAGHVSAAASPMPGVYPYVASGKLKALAVTSSSRVSKLPDVPTVAESGVEGFDFSSWYGVWGPAGLPQDIAEKLASEIMKATHTAEVKKQFDTMMFDVVESSPADLAKVERSEHEKISTLAKEANISIK
jgi:tripartite-type tricarboxylate transporter receptor subunit TctC